MDISNTDVDEVDEGLSCSLAASFANITDWESGNIGTCIEADVSSCQSTVELSPTTPRPASGPTRAPVPQVMLTPQPSQTESRSSALRTMFVAFTVSAFFVLLC
jgi:hypothetical protein